MEPVLERDENGLALTDGNLKLAGDFSEMKKRLKPANLNGELLVKAARIKGHADGLTLIDATAGMGEDSLLLAAAGFRVILFERNPVIHALLEDALLRAQADPELGEIVSRMTLYGTDSAEAMKSGAVRADVIYLDPMFPERQKSGLIKKKFQLLQKLECPCDDEEELMRAAMAAGPRKIIVKRPAKAECLAGVKPSYTVSGNSIRFDCIVL